MSDYKNFEILFTEQQIAKRVEELAKEIKPALDKYDPNEIVVTGLLKGVIFFFVDLIRALGSPDYRVELIKVSSYQGQQSTGNIKITGKMSDIRDKVVLLVDDIIDTGKTFAYFVKHLKMREPKELITVAFLDKPARREVTFTPDYVGFSIPDHFVVGYGLDCDENHRSLADIRIYNENFK